jgi:hypothetical protein
MTKIESSRDLKWMLNDLFSDFVDVIPAFDENED